MFAFIGSAVLLLGVHATRSSSGGNRYLGLGEWFPDDFMFQLIAEKAGSLSCQTGTLKTGR
jgi:hypothetical protein